MNSSYFIILGLIFTLFIYVPETFGESGRKNFPVMDDTFDNCYNECEDADYHQNWNSAFLKSSYLGGRVLHVVLPPLEEIHKMSIDSLDPNRNSPGAIYFKIPINDLPSSDLFNDVKISKAELKLLALPFPISEGEKGGYSGKLISSLFLCDNVFEHNPSFHCTYPIQPIDTVIVNTEELPKFLIFDITGTIDTTGNKELFFAMESKPIEDLKEIDLSLYSNFFFKYNEELREHNYGVTENVYEFTQISQANIPELFSEIIDQPIRKFFVSKLEYGDTSFGFEVVPKYEGEYEDPSLMFFKIDPDYADFFIIPSSGNTAVSPTAIIVDYEILGSDLSKAFTYFLGLGLPAIALIIPALIWITKKKN